MAKAKKQTKTKQSKKIKTKSKSKIVRKNPILSGASDKRFEKLREQALSFGSYVYAIPKDYAVSLKRSKPSYNYFFIDSRGKQSPIYHTLEELETALNVEKIVFKQTQKWDW